MKKRATIIGAGISSLSTACYLAKKGYRVTVLEKNSTIGGRARQFKEKGFTFDMGPSWYWMPEVFEKFYNDFGYTTSDFYKLHRLDPSYQVIWEDKTVDPIPADLERLKELFDQYEPGSSEQLTAFLAEAKYKYELGMQDLVYKPGNSIMEYADLRVMKGIFKLHVLSSFASYIRKYFKNDKILSLLEFPVLFLGATPKNTPALYSLMNYADIVLGTWYPEKGMFGIIEAFEQIAKELGVEIHTGEKVTGIKSTDKNVTEVQTTNLQITTDILISGADYAFTDKTLLGKNANYSDKYWDSRSMAPSSLIYYLGIDKKIPGLQHHNLFFDAPFAQHATEIYDQPSWPKKPLFYACVPSKTDHTVAPQGMENVFILIPTAPDLSEDKNTREHYLDIVLKRMEQHCGEDIRSHIVFQKSYCGKEFKEDYNAFKGNAYGLANTLKQTGILKPKIRNKKLKNMFYTGQLTVPGPGVPPAIISGKIVADEVEKNYPIHQPTYK